jgi:hypothetical protein
MIKVNGYYKVGNEIFYNKISALVAATNTSQHVSWIYHDDAYNRACSTFRLYDTSLEEIYKQRALQLRNQYDYLILNYSGGSDSHNILQTFLKNNIKLDMLFVQWPISLMEKGLYNPNVEDRSNYNFHSEWDFVLKNDLKWISDNYPHIKIEIADWALTINEKFYNDDLFSNNVTNLPSIARAQKQNTFSKEESKLANKGVKVGSIYGVDKPFIGFKEGNTYFRMADTTCMSQPNAENPNGLEYFYFTPNMPEIPVLQAYKMKQHFDLYPKMFYMAVSLEDRQKYYPEQINNPWYNDFHNYAELFKLVCYPYWNFNRFQADKPFSITQGLPLGVRAWDNILVKSLPNFDRTQKKWEYLWKSYQQSINTHFLTNDDLVSAIYTKWHKLQFFNV